MELKVRITLSLHKQHLKKVLPDSFNLNVHSSGFYPPVEILIYNGNRTEWSPIWSVIIHRVWKGFCGIWDSAEIECVVREYRKNPAVIREFYIGCDAGFS